jgi:hypothetical protein
MKHSTFEAHKVVIVLLLSDINMPFINRYDVFNHDVPFMVVIVLPVYHNTCHSGLSFLPTPSGTSLVVVLDVAVGAEKKPLAHFFHPLFLS